MVAFIALGMGRVIVIIGHMIVKSSYLVFRHSPCLSLLDDNLLLTGQRNPVRRGEC
jgi:hypothetical protein